MAALRTQGFEILGEREPWGQGKYEMGGIMVLAPNYSRMITLAPPQLKLHSLLLGPGWGRQELLAPA